ncbi:hypothetical protein F5I97DRAFT_1943939 [Phlebopus sp. FC_14]|nr:hypothetical protein F5I97DRAFT_1943939 [Phlebopus sp. FC_14]
MEVTVFFCIVFLVFWHALLSLVLCFGRTLYGHPTVSLLYLFVTFALYPTHHIRSGTSFVRSFAHLFIYLKVSSPTLWPYTHVRVFRGCDCSGSTNLQRDCIKGMAF